MSSPEFLKKTIRAFRDYLPFYAHQALLRHGLLPGSTDYTPFVIIATARTGTNLLRSLLNAHGQALAFGEIFRRSGAIGWDRNYYPRGGSPMRLAERDPGAFLERYLYRIQPAKLRAVGFKLFYEHAQEGPRHQVWDYLARRTDIPVIHLKRRNMLKTYLSLAKAHRSGIWESSGGGDNLGPIHLEPERCRTYFDWNRNSEARADRLFSTHRVLQLRYEELAADQEGQMRRVFEFLGLPYRPVRPSIRKQGRGSLRDSILNYDELKAHFAGSEWEEYFTE